MTGIEQAVITVIAFGLVVAFCMGLDMVGPVLQKIAEVLDL